MKRGTALWGLGLILLGGLSAGRSALAQAPAAAPHPASPDVLALIIQRPEIGDQVNLTYPHTVPHAQAKADVQALAQTGGWTVSDLSITDAAPPMHGKTGPMTSVVFTAPGLIQGETHRLPMEAFITAFRTQKHLRVVFITASNFTFEGTRSFADKDLTLTLDQRGNVFNYDVQILNSALSKVDLSAPAPAVRAARSPLLLFLGLFLLAAAVGALVYFLTARVTARPAPQENTADRENEAELVTKG